MANPSKKKGTRAETAVVNFLNAKGVPARRRPLSGSEDKGDIEIEVPSGTIVVEVKAGKMTTNPNRSQLEEWMAQARTEMFNNLGDSNGAWCLIVVRYNRRIVDADVWYECLNGDVCHMWLDEFCDKFPH